MVVTFPRLNPIIFKKDKVSFFEDYLIPFYQKWNMKDYIVFQVTYDKDFTSGDIIASLINEKGEGVSDCLNDIIDTGSLYQSIFRVCCDVPIGFYRIKLTTKNSLFTFYSNYFEIGKHENTMLIEYSCDDNKFDCVFKTTDYMYRFYLRIDGGTKSGDISYNADDVFYSSADRTIYLIDSIPYTVRKYTFGDSLGLPVWLADKINRVLACDSIMIDNIVVVKNDGAKLEAMTSDAYPYVGLKVELLYQEEGNSELLYEKQELMQSGLSVEMVDKVNSFSISAPKTGRIHVEQFEKTFN